MKRLCLSSLLILIVLSSISYAKSYQFDYQKNIEILGELELIVSNSFGDITVKGARVNTVTINAVKNVRAADQAEAERIADHIEIKARRQNRTISLVTNYLRLSDRASSFWEKLFGSGEDTFGDVDFDIIVPHECDIDIDNTSGTITITGITGNVDVVGSSENITLDEIEGELDIECTSGNIKITNHKGDMNVASGASQMAMNYITGSIQIHSTSGDKTFAYISGPVALSQTSGEVNIKSLNGDLRLKSTSGNIRVEQHSGAVDISTFTGGAIVKSELYSKKDPFVNTSSGNIIFTIPELSSGSVKLETKTGKIKTDMPMSIKSLSEKKIDGVFGSGGPKITLTSISGDITIGRY